MSAFDARGDSDFQFYDAPRWECIYDRLWCLLEMLKDNAERYIKLGARLQDSRARYDLAERDGRRALTEQDKTRVGFDLQEMSNLCREINLPVSADLLSRRTRKDDLPQTAREMDLLCEAVLSELRSIVFVRLSSGRATYYENDNIVSQTVRTQFPSVFREIRLAGNCFAADLYTATVFHAMRAAEIGLRSLAGALGVSFPFPMELADWQNIIEKIEAEIKSQYNLPKSAKKDEDIQLFSG